MLVTRYPIPPRDRDGDAYHVADLPRFQREADLLHRTMYRDLAEPVFVVGLGGNVPGIHVAMDSANPLIVTDNGDPDGLPWVAFADLDPYTVGFGTTPTEALRALRLSPIVVD